MSATDIIDVYPLSPIQEGLLFHAVSEPESDAYFVQMRFEVVGELDERTLNAAWQALCERHDVLRTSFVYEGLDRPLQAVHATRPAELHAGDLRTLDSDQQQARLEAFCRDDRRQGFDLQRDVLTRIALFRTGDRTYHLVWSYHHVLLDGWSLGLLQREFAELYASLAEKRTPRLGSVRAYREYIAWLGAQDSGGARRYWAGVLAGYEAAVSVPAFGGAGPSRFEERAIRLDAALTHGLVALAAQSRVTLSTLVQAIWGVQLARYNDTLDAVFGIVVSGRPAELDGVEQIVGPFINTVPLRVTIDPAQPFSALLTNLQVTGLEGAPFHHAKLAEIAGASALGRALFDHVLVFDNYPAVGTATKDRTGIEFRGVGAHDWTHYAFSIVAVPGEQLQVKFLYDAATYGANHVARIAGHFEELARAVAARPETLVGDLHVLTTTEREELVRWGSSNGYAPPPHTVVDLLEAQAARTPEAIALRFRERSISYRDMNERANFLAEQLRTTYGIRPEDRVGILLDRGDDLVVAVLAVLKTGAAYIPVDPDYPAARLGYLLEDGGVRAIVTRASHRSTIADDVPVLELPAEGQRARNPPRLALPEHLAYVLYTSGTTGKPKGVEITHASLLFYLLWANGYYFDSRDRGSFALFSSISFDLTVTSLFLPLLRGRTLTVLAQEIEPATVLETIFNGSAGVDSVKLTPSHVAMLEFLDVDSTSVELAIVGGEAFTPQHARLLRKLNPAMRIVNEYGPTEATVGCIVHDARPGEASIPIGRPIAGSCVAIRDRAGALMPIGVPGEMFVGGPGLARGYRNRPQLDRERFSGEGEARMYRTGDYGRWLESGVIEYLGRKDDQVKIRGHRVELGEVENALQQAAGVARAAVLAQGDSIAAYVENPTLAVQTIRERLRELLPAYMLPSPITFVARMPLTAHGKIDRARLAREYAQEIDAQPAGVQPRDETERAVAAIWSDVLGQRDFSVDENFFDAGGHSLKAMQVISRIRKAFGTALSLRDFLTDPTIAASAARIGRSKGSAVAAIPCAPEQDDYPLSHAQERLWLIHRMGGEIAYNMPEAFLFEEELELAALRAAFAALVERHAALRTAFVPVGGEPRQRVLAHVDLPLREIDLRGEADPLEAARAIAERDAMTPFALDRPPLVRMTVMRLSQHRFVVLLTLHHIIGDGWSLSVLKSEMLALYAAFARGQDSPLRPLRIAYTDFALWQHARDHAQSEQYWMKELTGCTEGLRLPYDGHPPEEARDFRGATLGRRLDPALVASLQALASREKTTLSNAVLTCFALALWQSSRQDDFCIGLSEANRDDVDLESLVGFFVNILPIRVGVREETSPRDLFSHIGARVYDALEHRDYPFDLLVQKLNPGRVANRQPLLNVVYGFQSFRDIRIETAGADSQSALAAASPFGVPFRTSKFDLCLFVSEIDGTLLLELEYDTGLFHEQTAANLLCVIEECARILLDKPDERLGALTFHRGSTTQALSQRVRALNETATAYPKGTSVHGAFSAMAQRYPQHTAVAFRHTRMTYEELDRRSNEVARLLVDRGVTAESFVGVLLDRSPQMIVALLGVLKAGAAYVPLDSSMPYERLRHITIDTRARWLICERAHLRIANKLHWESPELESLLCIDSDDFSHETEDGGLMEAAIWEYIAQEAFDDISGGGWKDSYTGEWLSRAVMDEYGDNILEKLRPLIGADSRVLEIGCATGISMFRVAPLVAQYVGTDLSPGIVAWSEQEAQRRGLHNIRLFTLPAHEVDRVGEGGFDVVILNSVIECFPGHNYLYSVLRKALALMGPQGYVFLGNLWDQDLKPAFERSLQAFKREHPERSVSMKLDRCDELFISRAFVEDLRHEFPEIEAIEYSSMIGSAASELSQFGFDAVLRIRKGIAHRAPAPRTRHRFDRQALRHSGDAPLAQRGSPATLAYMMYTSGTSGAPKGVMTEHRGVVRLVRDTNYITLGPDDAVLHCGALGFDASTFEIWGPLLNGGCVVLPEGKSFLHPADLARTLREHRVTTLFLTTGLFNHIADLDVEVFGSLRTLLTGGEQASVTHFNAVRAHHPRLRLLHVYGPTENTTFSTFFDVTTAQTRIVPIGRPIANTTAVVVNERGALVPFGSPGELCVGGDGLARGYWRDEELTARKFVGDPLDASRKVYRTGDLVRWRPDGEIEFLGRIDTQIKIRGYRIELEELEGVLLRHALVSGAAVVAGDFGSGEMELAAFVTGTGLDAQMLLDHVKAVLPEYLIPSRVIIMPKLPLNASGKVDRKQLVVPAPGQSAQRFVEPSTPLEKELADIWARLLNRSHIGATANFFGLGGHSLKVARMVSMIQMELGVEVSISAVFRAPTIRELAGHITEVSQLDRRLIDDPLVRLSNAAGTPVFAFPPGSGYCLSYLRLATLLPQPLLGFAFIDSNSRFDEYVSLILEAQPEGPHVLFGYSAGGKLAFAVAQELERRGATVSDVVIFDAARYLRTVSFSDAEIREIAAEFLDEITSRVLREQAFHRIKRYRDYLGTCVESGSIQADIHLVVAEESQRVVTDGEGHALASLDGWRDLTTGRFKEYRGSGRHREMLGPTHVERNAEILRSILGARPAGVLLHP